MKTLIFGFMLLASTSALADFVTMKLHFEGTDFYRVQQDQLIGDLSNISGQVSLEGTVDGENIQLRRNIPFTQVPNNTVMEIQGKDRLRIIDQEGGVDGVTRANVQTTLFGNLKGIKISSQDYLAIMKPVLESSGLDMLQGFNLNFEDGSIETDLSSSDINCDKNQRDELACESSIDITITISNEKTALSDCKFSSQGAAVDFARAINGNTRSLRFLSDADINQSNSCVSAIEDALVVGKSYVEISNQVTIK